MAEIHLPRTQPLVSGTWSALLILIGIILIGMAIGSILGVGLLTLIGDGDFNLNEIIAAGTTAAYDAESWLRVILLQAVYHLFSFLIPALVFWKLVERKGTEAFNLQNRNSYAGLVPIFFLTIVLMPFTGMISEWNESMILPDSLSGIEAWMKENELTLANLTEYFLSFQTIGQLLIAVVVIAIIPAIGEEVLFRGILQRKLAEHWANVHLAIWVSAFIFSVIHFQFYGFFPRLFLGAMFGYLYFWTGRLAMAIFAHFVNNAVTVVLMWMYRQKMIDIDIASSQSVPVWTGLLSLVAALWLLRIVYKSTPGSAAA